jgi:capsule biosynthesis phosphatase
MKYVFDIDGTICSDTKGDYQTATPILERIEIINQLFAQGHQIIFYTARGMGTSGNNIELAQTKWFEFTNKQLTDWGVNFHHLFLGKPSGDMYIDDKAVTDSNFFS